MISVNELPTMEFHFFEPPNKILITESSYKQFITAELDFNFDFNFCLDAKSFDILKKLATNRKIRKTDNSIIIESDEGKFKCQIMKKERPELKLSEVVYEHTYKDNLLKEATRFVDSNKARAVLTGVLLNDVGDVFATDTVKLFYFRPKILPYTRFWAIPVYFIGLLPQGEITLKFTDTRVFYEGRYNIYSSVYDGKMPLVEKISDCFISDHYIAIDKKDELSWMQADSVEFKITSDKIVLIFDDNEKRFEVEYDEAMGYELNKKIGYDHFSQILSTVGDSMFIEFSDRSLRVNKKIIVSYRQQRV